MAVKDPLIEEVREFRRSDPEALAKVLRDYRDARDRRKPRQTLWETYYWMFRNKLKINRALYPLLSRSSIAIAFSHIETAVPFLMDALYDERRFIHGFSQNDPDKNDEAKTIGDWMTYDFVERIGYEVKLERTIRSAKIYGTAWQKTFWEVGSQIDWQDMTPEERERARNQLFKDGSVNRRKFYDGSQVEPVDLFEIYPDPAARDPKNMRFLIHVYDLPLSKFLETAFDSDGKAIYDNLNDILNTVHPDQDRQERVQERVAAHGKGETGLGTDSVTAEENFRNDRTVEIMDYWTNGWLVKIVNQKTVLFNGPNPNPFQKIPFTIFRPLVDPDFLWGIGTCEMLRSMQENLNIINNQTIDNVNLRLFPQWRARRGSAPNIKQHVNRLGAVLYMDDPQTDMVPHQIPDATGNGLAHMQNIIRHMENTSGVLDLFQGQQPDTSRFPASGIALLQRASGRRFRTEIRNYRSAIREVIGLSHALNQAFLKDERVGRVLGIRGDAQYPRVDGELLGEAFVDFKPMGKSAGGDPEVTAQILQTLDQQWADTIPPEGKLALRETILDLLDISRIAEILPNQGENKDNLSQPERNEPGPPDFNDVVSQSVAAAGGGGGAPGRRGVPLALLSQPPSRTNPGGLTQTQRR